MLSYSEYQKLVEQSPIMIWRSNKDTLCDYFNETWLEFTGKTLAEEYGNGWAKGVHPEDYDRCLKIYLENFEKRQSFEMEYRLKRHDGTYRWIFDRGSPFYNDDGEFLGFIGSCIDITQRVEARETLKLLEESKSKQMSEVASVISHQWKQPLNNLGLSISLFVQKYETHKVNDEVVESFKSKYQELIREIDHTIDDFKSFFHTSHEKTMLDVCDTVEKVVRMMSDTFKNNDIHVSLSKNGCGKYLAKKTDLSQVLLNIIANSKEAFVLAAIQNRNIKITIDNSDSQIILSIADNAGGVDESYIDKVKDKFFTTKDSSGGSGIGLYISDVILKQIDSTMEMKNLDNGLLTTIKIPKVE